MCIILSRGKEERTYYEGEVQQKKILKMIVDGAKSLDLYRQNLRMVPHDIQPVCQEMFVKVTDDVTTGTSKQTDFNTVLQKTKKHGSSEFYLYAYKNRLLSNYS